MVSYDWLNHKAMEQVTGLSFSNRLTRSNAKARMSVAGMSTMSAEAQTWAGVEGAIV